MSGAELTLANVDKIYNADSTAAVHAVKALDMSIRAGEMVALLGSSGCGKTSTLRMIAGFEAVTTGSIEIAGKAIQNLPPAKRGVAMAFEGYSLYPPLTVRDNIGFALQSQRINPTEIDKRVREIAELLEIESILDRYPSSISGGEQQRASLARALVRDAHLHLLDEPMGQLEPQLRALLRGRLKHFIKERNLTAILVTHDQTEANALADRIAVMEEGSLQQFASPDELRDRPANLFTGTFIGEPPMNVLDAEVAENNNELVFTLSPTHQLHYPLDAFTPVLRERLCLQRQVTIGVRPHAIKLSESGMQARVSANQWLGDQSHIAASIEGRSLVAVTHERVRVAAGDEISIALGKEDLHIFNCESGAVIAHGGELA